MSQRNDDNELMAAAWAGKDLTAAEQDRAKQAFTTRATDPNSLGGRLVQGLAKSLIKPARKSKSWVLDDVAGESELEPPGSIGAGDSCGYSSRGRNRD